MADRDYEVGYGKPPVGTRFRPGQSGNPSGKRKPRPTLSELMDMILGEKVTVTEGDRKRRLPKEQVFIRQIINRALSGDRQASKLIFEYLLRRQADPGAAETAETDAFLLGELAKLVGEKPQETCDD